MGGLGGNMSHLYGDKGLKLIELTSIIKQVASGDIRYNEKADGQNFHVTLDENDEVYFARNKTDYKNIGRTVASVEGDYIKGGLSAQAEIFGDGGRAIEAVLKSLSSEMKSLVFGDPSMQRTYINCEIIHIKHPNLVVYDRNHIQFHEFKVEGETEYDDIEGLNILNKKFSSFLKEVEGQSVTVPAYAGGSIEFTIDGPQFLPAATENMSPEEVKLFEQQTDEAVLNLKSLFSSVGLIDSSTVGDYLIAKISDEVLPEFNIHPSVVDDVSHYIVYGTDASGTVITNKKELGSTLRPFKDKLKSVLGKELADKLTLGKYKNFQNGLAGAAIAPLKEIIHNFSLSIVNSAESVLATDPGLAKYATKKAISNMGMLRQAVIEDYSEDPGRLERNLAKFERELALLGDVEKFSQSMEGVVINYVRDDGMPMLYKLTGNFAPANQLLGLSMQGFKIKRDLLEKAKSEYRSMSYNPTPEDETDPVNEARLRKAIRESILKRMVNLI